MENKSNKLKAKDFITIGIFSAILFAVEFAFGMLGYIHPIIVAAARDACKIEHVLSDQTFEAIKEFKEKMVDLK